MNAWSRVLGVTLALQATAGCGESTSNESSGGESGGSTSSGGSGRTGGSSGSGGSATGGSTSGNGGGGQIPESPLCEPFAEHAASACPEAWTVEAGLRECEDGFQNYYPVGCGTEWGDFVTCMTLAEIDCATGSPIGCTPAELGYTSCIADFVAQTGCVQAGPSEMCPAGQFSFGCLGGVPNVCTEYETDAAVPYGCCLPFPD